MFSKTKVSMRNQLGIIKNVWKLKEKFIEGKRIYK